jgi:L-iditol 2-dehydrogenase
VNNQMTAAVLYGKEDVQIERRRSGSEPGDVLVRVRAALTCGTDVKVFRRGYHARMIVPPALFGHELAGDIVALGEASTGSRWGQRVVAANSAPCGNALLPPRPAKISARICCSTTARTRNTSAFRRASCEKNTYEIPPSQLSGRRAGRAAGLRAARAGRYRRASGDTVAVIGAGPHRLMFVRLAKVRGARVIAVGRRPQQLERGALGADETVDRRRFGCGARCAS